MGLFSDERGYSGGLINLVAILGGFMMVFTFGMTAYASSVPESVVNEAIDNPEQKQLGFTRRLQADIPADYMFEESDGSITLYEPQENKDITLEGAGGMSRSFTVDLQEIHTTDNGWALGILNQKTDQYYSWNLESNTVGKENLLVIRPDGFVPVYVYVKELIPRKYIQGTVKCTIYENWTGDSVKSTGERRVGDSELLFTVANKPMEAISADMGVRDILFGVLTLDIPLVPSLLQYPITFSFYLFLGLTGFLIAIKVIPTLGG